MNIKQLVSVIMPAFNSEEYIAEAIESVLLQTYQEIELIIIDDGSTDNTFAIINKYAKACINKVVFLQQQNAGPASARNKGILIAKGVWIAFIDSDDIWNNDHVEKLMFKASCDDSVDIVYGSKILIDKKGTKLASNIQPDYDMPEGWIFTTLFSRNIMCTSSIIAKKQKIMEVGLFNESPNLRIAEDYDLFLKLTAISKVSALPKVKYLYRRHNNNISLDDTKYSRGLISAIDNAIKLIRNDMVDKRNDMNAINIKQRITEVYEHAVLNAYYSRNYNMMIEFLLESISRGVITWKIIQVTAISLLPKKLREYTKKIVTVIKADK